LYSGEKESVADCPDYIIFSQKMGKIVDDRCHGNKFSHEEAMEEKQKALSLPRENA
tara:strand:- start:882 stop:1049 length:168 start_codon:yes stop_codon:yes gene_type:complete